MRKIDLNITLLRCFVSVVEAGGLTAAAKRIGLTQSGVSVRIKRLEALVGTRLLLRTSRSLEVTEEGLVLLDNARQIIALNDQTVLQMMEPEISGVLRVGIADYLAPQRLPNMLREFTQLFPKLELNVRTGLGMDLRPALERDEIDLVIAGFENDVDDYEILFEEPLIWVASKDFTLAEDLPLKMTSLPEPCSFRKAAIRALKKVNRQWSIALTCSSISGVQAAVLGGMGVAVLPQSAFLRGMKVLTPEAGFSALGSTKIAAYGVGCET